MDNSNNRNNDNSMYSICIIIIVVLFFVILGIYSRKPDSIININKKHTIVDTFRNIVKKYHNHPAFKIKYNNKWMTVKYGEYYRQCNEFANSLLAIKVQRPILIIGNNAPEWSYAYIGSIMSNLIPVGVYPTSTPHICTEILNNCTPEVLIVEDMKQLQKFINPITSKNTKIRVVVSYSEIIDKELEKTLKIPVYTWNQFLNMGKYINIDIERRQIKHSDVATIIYTSGTTGKPKGVMITHNNIVHMIDMLIKRMNKCPTIHLNYAKERLVSYLPLNHIAAQLLDIYLPIYIAATVWTTRLKPAKEFALALNKAKPTIFAGVPRVWEKIMETIEAKKNELPFMKRLLIDISSNFIDIYSYFAIKKLGLDECKYNITMGAPISHSVLEYYRNIGSPLYNVYGLSETSGPISMETPCQNSFGSVGMPLDNINIKIKDKEILVSGPTIFYGYYGNDEATNQAFDSDGWYKTGDMGYIHDGYLYITGRRKELIITSGGENVAPTEIEDRIKKYCPLIDHAIVIGNNKKYLTVLLTLKIEVAPDGDQTILFTKNAQNILKLIGSKSQNIIDAREDKIIKQYIDESIKKVNNEASSNVHTIKKWIILPNAFSIKGGELTPTMKLKRNYINEKYKKYIDYLY